jgi:hypothetical protein
MKTIRNHNQSLSINSKWKWALVALIPWLEIIEIRKFRTTSESIFLFYLASPTTSDVSKLLRCIFCTVSLLRIALLEIDYNWNWACPSVPQSICRDLFDSHIETTRSNPVIEELNYLPLRWCSLFLSKCFFLSFCVSHTDRKYQSINRDITDLNTCEYTFKGLNRYDYTFTGLNRCEYTFSANKSI